MSGIATAVIGSAVVGGIVSQDASRRAANAASGAAASANAITQEQLDFQRQQYADQRPMIDALGAQAVRSAEIQNQAQLDATQRARRAWEQNQAATQGSVGLMGLNALGAQYLDPEQTKELLGLQDTIGGPQALSPAERARLDELVGLQSRQRQQIPGAPTRDQALDLRTLRTDAAARPTASPAAPTSFWGSLGRMVQGAAQGEVLPPGATEALPGPSGWTSQMQQELAALQERAKIDPNARNAAMARIAELQRTARANAIGLEGAKAEAVRRLGTDYQSSVAANADKYGGELIGLADVNANNILGNSKTITDEMRQVAAQRAADYEKNAATSANASIATARGEAERELLRLGGDPNKMAALSAQLTNADQLARITSGNQVARTNIANLNSTEDQVMGIKSSALEAARAARAGAAQTALGMRATAADQGLNAVTSANTQATGITNNAGDKVNATLNALQQGTANFGAGFANTSGQQQQAALAAGTSAVGNLNTAAQSTVPMTNASNNAFANAISGARTAGSMADDILRAGNNEADAYTGLGGAIAGYIRSSKKSKTAVRKIDHDDVIDGLERAAPQSFAYKDGEGPRGRKVGAMAEDLNREFGDDVAPGGEAVDVQNMIGLEHAAIVGLAKRVKRLERRA